MNKSEETIELFGEKLPKWQDCTRCGEKLACQFIEGIGYYQPCEKCRKTPEYRQELNKKIQEDRKNKRIDESLEAKKPAAYHQTPWGTYLVTNKRGDVLEEKKMGAVKKGEKARVRAY